MPVGDACRLLTTAHGEESTEEKADSARVKETRQLFDGKSLEGWEATSFGGEGEVAVQEGQIVMEMGTPLTGINYKGEVPKTNYEISLEAMQVDGFDFFCGLTFPVADSFCSFIVAGWSGAVVGLSNVDDRDASENATTRYMTFKEDTWYKVRVRVQPAKITCWIDDEKVVEQLLEGHRISIRPEVGPCKPLGIAAFETRSALKNIQLRILKED